MKIYKDLIQGTPEWFQTRCGIATGSNFDAVLAKVKTGEAATRRQYRARLACERLTGTPAQELFKSQAMQDGTAREPIARSLVEFRFGFDIEEVGFIRHDTIECGVSPDSLIDTDGMLEIKCPTPAVHLEYMRRTTMPPEYVAQVQGQLFVAERKWCLFASFNPEFPENARLVTRKVYRDDAYIKNLESELVVFIEEVRREVEEIRNYKEAA